MSEKVAERGSGAQQMSSGGWQPLAPPAEPGAAARESCTMNAIISGAAGGVMGLALGAVLFPFSNSQQVVETENLPMREQVCLGHACPCALRTLAAPATPHRLDQPLASPFFGLSFQRGGGLIISGGHT